MLLSRFFIIRKDSEFEPIEIEIPALTIGRLPEIDLELNHPAVSGIHAGIKEIDGKFWINNFSRTNGTYVNGEAVDRIPLEDDDVVQIGPYFLRIEYLEICSNCGSLYENLIEDVQNLPQPGFCIS